MKCNIKQEIAGRFRNRQALISLLHSAAYWFLSLIYLELLLHIAAYGMPDLRFAFVLGFSLVFACALALLTSFLPRKVHFPVTVSVAVLVIVLYGSQLVYYFVFGTLYSVALIQQGGAAITTFWKEMLLTMWKNLPWLLALFVPVAGLVLLRKFRRDVFAPSNGVWRGILLAAALLVQVVPVLCLRIGGTGYFTNYYFYHSDLTTTDQAAERFGLLTAFRLDILGAGQSPQPEEEENDYFVPEETTVPKQDTAQGGQEESEQEPVVEYNILDIDFDELNGLTSDEKIQAINQYCASLTGTNKNEYTGMLRDYNLIVLCAESFATGAIDQELTPTLYRLANEGIVFNNYYNTYPNNTTDGEYTLCMGLYPDTTRGKSASSFYASRNSYVPYCLGNMFSKQLGIKANGYHNNVGSYYGRRESHRNMGYSMQFANQGMWFTTTWPTSDLEMMKQSVDDYISQDQQFHAYYMTFSGHMAYDTSVNLIAARNWNEVAGLSYSDPAKCYLSCNIELDKALEYLMERLEAEGIADKTAIVLAGDHFPYGLTNSQYSELVGYKIDDFSKYKSTLIFWVGGLEENIVVDEYCCNADILPTILNLWGFDYDSRMLAGTDVFSDGTHMAILSDMSFLTEKVWLNGSTGEVKYLVDESEVSGNYVENMIKLVKTKFSVSKDILNTAYYNFVFEQGNVSLDRESWYKDQNTSKEEKPEKTEEPEKTEDVPEPTEKAPEPTENTPKPTEPKPTEPKPTEPPEPTEGAPDPTEETQPPTEETQPPAEETVPPTEEVPETTETP